MCIMVGRVVLGKWFERKGEVLATLWVFSNKIRESITDAQVFN